MFDPDLLQGTSAADVPGKFQALFDRLFGKG